MIESAPRPRASFVDIHCHLLPMIDDGAQSWEDTLAMACIASQAGTRTIIATPHQLGNYQANTGDRIRQHTAEVQQFLDHHAIDLKILPGGDVRIEETMLQGIADGSVMTLADHRKHVLLELPHEVYFPLEGLIDSLQRSGIQAILSHPERNVGLLTNPALLAPLVDRGCLMQVTCGSLVGTFGPNSQRLSEYMLGEGLVHFLASDGHSPRRRRPHMHRGFQRASELVGDELALEICCINPGKVACGQYIDPGRRVPCDVTSTSHARAQPTQPQRKKRGWFSRRPAA